MKINALADQHSIELFICLYYYLLRAPATYRMCMNSMEERRRCLLQTRREVWWSAWGYEEEGKVHARLTCILSST